MQADMFFWLVGRATGLAAFVALTIAVLSGIALRTSVLDRIGSNRAWLELHTFGTVLWLPLSALHVIALLVDKTARIAVEDLFIPFGVAYGRVEIGLGTIALDLVLLVTITGFMKRRMPQRLWSWIHRLSYPAFGLAFAHSILAGSDFSAPSVSAVMWSVAFAVLVLAGARIVWGRLPA